MYAARSLTLSYVTPTVDVIKAVSDFLTDSTDSSNSLQCIQGEWD